MLTNEETTQQNPAKPAKSMEDELIGSNACRIFRSSRGTFIIRKRLTLPLSLHQILQILSVALFEKTPFLQALHLSDPPG